MPDLARTGDSLPTALILIHAHLDHVGACRGSSAASPPSRSPSGHLPGAASILIEHGKRTVFHPGDVSNVAPVVDVVGLPAGVRLVQRETAGPGETPGTEEPVTAQGFSGSLTSGREVGRGRKRLKGGLSVPP